MKKFLLSLIIALMVCGCGYCSEIEDDYLDIAANYCVVGQYNKAIEYLDKILALNPDNKKVYDLKRGLNHILSGDKSSYISSVNPFIIEAQEYKKTGDLQGEYSSLLKGGQSTNSYLAYYYLGNFFRDNKDWQKALEFYNNATSAKPDFAPAYLASGIVLFDIGRYESAINPIDKYLTFEPDDDLAYAVKSRAEFQMGLLDASKSDNDRALELNDCPEYRFDKAKLLYKYGDYTGAKDLFNKLLAEIQTSKIYEYLGYCYYELGDYVSALMNIDKAIILSDDDEYLENKYNEIKTMLESSNRDEQSEEQ